jgi:1,4-dihydroxy-2-naphthoate octaprenyltransferase
MTPDSATTKSVITCDLEGRIETFSKGAEEIFGYAPDEVIGKKRVSLFSPGLVVLEHVPGWLSTAVKDGKFESQTVFLRKDGSPFAADVKITPTFKDDEQIGYCGVTTPRDDVDVAQAMPKISAFTKVFAGLVVTRAPFLTATIAPLLVSAAAVVFTSGWSALSWPLFALVLVGGCALHVGANVFNDYFDYTSGTDEANNDYFLPFSGGSRAIELGLITPRGLLAVGVTAFAVAVAAGVVAAFVSTSLVWAFGLAGAFGGFFYTAPPLRLVARKGLGELFIGLCFGPLLVLGARAVLDGGLSAQAIDQSLYAGIALGLLTTNILWINQFPDLPGDAATGKNNLVVVLGRRAARWGYLSLFLAAFATLGAGVALGALPLLALLPFVLLPYGLWATRVVFEHYDDRTLVRANKATIILHLGFGLLLAAGLALALAV